MNRINFSISIQAALKVLISIAVLTFGVPHLILNGYPRVPRVIQPQSANEATPEQTQTLVSILKSLGYDNVRFSEYDKDDQDSYYSDIYADKGIPQILVGAQNYAKPEYRGKDGLSIGIWLAQTSSGAEDRHNYDYVQKDFKYKRILDLPDGRKGVVYGYKDILNNVREASGWVPYGSYQAGGHFICGNIRVNVRYGKVSSSTSEEGAKKDVASYVKECMDHIEALVHSLSDALCLIDEYRIEGTALDWFGRPLREMKISLKDQQGRELPYVTATDRKGFYSFNGLSRKLDDLFDPNSDRVRVHAQLTIRRGDKDFVDVVFRNRINPLIYTGIQSDAFPMPPTPQFIRRDFSFNTLARGYLPFPNTTRDNLPHLAAIYSHFHEAFLLTDKLNLKLDYSPPLAVHTFASSKNEAYWSGSFSNSRTYNPYILLGTPTSWYGDPGRPDNREWHEYGHHIMAEAFDNAMPGHPSTENHEGYFINPSTTDAWSEGFAEFFSTMTAKHVAGYSYPHFYHMIVPGFYIDLELDYRAWRPPYIGEELAVASLLLDLEDGPEDYAVPNPDPDIKVLGSGIAGEDGDSALVGRVQNTGRDDALHVVVFAAFYDANGAVIHQSAAQVHPRDLRGTMPRWLRSRPVEGQIGIFGFSLKDVPAFDHYEVAVTEIIRGGNRTDDDPVNLTLEDVWSTIIRHRSSAPRYTNGYMYDIKDLYQAFKTGFGGQDKNRNRVDDIDEIFIAHGFFADQNGDRIWQPSEKVGDTDHPAFAGLSDMIPRRKTPVQPGAFVQYSGQSGGQPVDINRFILETRYAPPNSHLNRSQVVDVTDPFKGKLYIIMPPETYKAKCYVTPLAAGYKPGKTLTIDSTDYWKAMDKHPDDSFLSHTFELKRADPGDETDLMTNLFQKPDLPPPGKVTEETAPVSRLRPPTPSTRDHKPSTAPSQEIQPSPEVPTKATVSPPQKTLPTPANPTAPAVSTGGGGVVLRGAGFSGTVLIVFLFLLGSMALAVAILLLRRRPKVPSVPRAELIMVLGDESHKTYSLTSKRLSIGRSQNNNIIIEDERVSRNHAEIILTGSGYVIQDLSSSLGMKINGEKMLKCLLNSNCEIQIGEARLHFRIQ
jgi:hypothetical protein